MNNQTQEARPGAKTGLGQKDFDPEAFVQSDEYKRLKALIDENCGPRRYVYWEVKRLFDIICSLLVLILLSPLYLILSIIIVIDDPKGGPIYSQIRIGRKGKPFKFYKFRSMCVNADELLDSLKDKNEKDGPMFKIKDDPRITRVGHFIRKTSLDEFPQFWNVLKGDMSMVGPRPSLPREVAQFTPLQMQRLEVTPGLTCIWQTAKNRDDIGFDQWVEMDLDYIRRRSWSLDLRLIFKTVLEMFHKGGN